MIPVVQAMIDSFVEHLRWPVHDFMPKAAPADTSAGLWWFTCQGKDLRYFTFSLEALLTSTSGLTQAKLVFAPEGMEDRASFQARFFPWRQVQMLSIEYAYERPESALKKAELCVIPIGVLSLLPPTGAKFNVFTDDKLHGDVEAFVQTVLNFARK